MSEIGKTQTLNTVTNENNTPSCENDDVKYKKIGGTTYTVVSNYIGKNSLLDIVKSAIKRDIESGNY